MIRNPKRNISKSSDEMKKSDKNKRYIYNRDQHKCLFCGKDLLFKQMSVDHYLPKSKNGPNDVFNLVLSCKRCNKQKQSTVPEDYRSLMIDLFKRAYYDRKLITENLKIKGVELSRLIDNIKKLNIIGEYSVFESANCRMYVKKNRIEKIIYVAEGQTL